MQLVGTLQVAVLHVYSFDLYWMTYGRHVSTAVCSFACLLFL